MVLIKKHLYFTLISSVITIFIGLSSNQSFYIGEGGTLPNNTEALILTLVFLLVYMLYGIIMGFRLKKDFITFITLYWGISGIIGLTGSWLLPFRGNPLKRVLGMIGIPIVMFTCMPASGLKYFYPSTLNNESMVPIIVCILSPWSAGALGYLLGYVIQKIRVAFSKEEPFSPI